MADRWYEDFEVGEVIRSPAKTITESEIVDWAFTYDPQPFHMDKEAAAATRRKVFGMVAADKIPFIGYHMPFPALGFVETRDDGFRYVPATYQLQL